MSAPLKPGARITSPVCTAEFVVVRAPADLVGLRWAGAGGGPGARLGKRYVDADGTLELLCTKAGPSSPAVGDAVLAVKGAKPLPASD